MIPAPWEFALLVLGAFRLSRLVGWDTITAGLRYRVTGVDDDHAADVSVGNLPPGATRRQRTRAYLSTLIRCPWCQGFYVSAAVWALWAWLGDPVLAACAPLAVSSAVGLIAKNLDP